MDSWGAERQYGGKRFKIMRSRGKLMWGFLLAASLAIPVWANEAVVRCTHRELPGYPALLRGLKIGGTVKLRVSVAPDGKVQKTTVQGGNPMLAELSCMAVKKWTFTSNARASEVLVELVFDPSSSVPSVVE
jgi:TonB family protein